MFLAGAAVVARVLHTETGLPIGYGRACLVQLAYMVMGFVLALVFGMVMALMFRSMLAGLHGLPGAEIRVISASGQW